jgi:hypothetical protein
MADHEGAPFDGGQFFEQRGKDQMLRHSPGYNRILREVEKLSRTDLLCCARPVL